MELEEEDDSEDLGDSEDDDEEMEEVITDPVEKELKKYLELSFGKKKCRVELKEWLDDPTTFWAPNRKKFPLLSHVWRRIGAIKGASASAERIFSLAGFLISARRWNMDSESLNCIVLQHNWLERGLM